MMLSCFSAAQHFKTIPREVSENILLSFNEILCTSKGLTWGSHSMGMIVIDNMQLEILMQQHFTDEKGENIYLGKNSNIYKDQRDAAGMKLWAEGPDETLFVVSNNNNFGHVFYKIGKAILAPPFNFKSPQRTDIEVTKIWVDSLGSLFIATNSDSIYFVRGVTDALKAMKKPKIKPSYKAGLDKDSNFVITEGALPIHSFSLGSGVIPYSFADDPHETRLLWIGTNSGIYAYDKPSGQKSQYLALEPGEKCTITNLRWDKQGKTIWFSTLESGMGKFDQMTKNFRFFLYPKKPVDANMTYPIKTFSVKSEYEYFVAIADSLPAIFNTETGKYTFIDDILFKASKNVTSDIKADILGNLFICKGGALYWGKNWMQNNSKTFSLDSAGIGPSITAINVNGKNIGIGIGDSTRIVRLKHKVQLLDIFIACRGIDRDSLVYSWKLEGLDDKWTELPYSFFDDGTSMIHVENLDAGNYTLHVRAKKIGHEWVNNEATLNITVEPPFWLTWWFWLACIAGITAIVALASFVSARKVRRQERIKAEYEKEALELEAKALRSQMNPHFIFNCMNSIKSLISQNESEKANKYLTTFSKLMRTIFQSSDKREINLYEEIETCQLYVQLESMRFGSKLHYEFNVDSSIDLKSVKLPALIIQPFLENAIWHGIMPKEAGGSLIFSVEKRGSDICCIIDDDGIGREMSKQNKFRGEPSTHESKGVHLTQNRLDVDNMLTDRQTKVEIIDKKDGQGSSLGTRVILTFQDI
jgi:Histidine kinase/Y_Y_Y domain